MIDGIDIPALSFGGGTAHGRTPEQHRIQVALRQVNETALFVDPLGNLREFHVEPPNNGMPVSRGDTVVIFANDELQIAKRYRDEGYTMFSEWCTDEPEKLEGYRELMRARARGIPIRIADWAKVLPEKLMAKREAAKVGAVDGKAFVPGEGVVDDPEIRKGLDEKLASLGLEPPEESDEPKRRRRGGS